MFSMSNSGPFSIDSSGKQRKDLAVAVVDDNPGICKLVSDLVVRLGFKSPAFVARDGQEIVNAVTKEGLSPDIIIMDYRLPGIDGIEASKIITKTRPGTKIIVATAEDSIKPTAVALGFGFLQKPFSIRELLRAISS